MLQRGTSEALQFDGEDAELVQRMVFERIGGEVRLAQVAFLEGVGVDDGDAVWLQVANVDFQGRRIHGDQDVDGVTRGMHFTRGKIQLIAADAGNCAGRSANLRGIVRESSDIVSIERDGIRKLAARDLHAIAGIAGETDHRLVNYLALRFPCRNIDERGHRATYPRLPLTPLDCRKECVYAMNGRLGVFPEGAIARPPRPALPEYHSRAAAREARTRTCVTC